MLMGLCVPRFRLYTNIFCNSCEFKSNVKKLSLFFLSNSFQVDEKQKLQQHF